MKVAEVVDNNEKGRHFLNASDSVMLVKNRRQDVLEKFRVNCES